MFVNKLKLKNFKCFSENEISFSMPDGQNVGSGLNIFVGENNSGKSSLIEALYFVRNKIKKNVKKIGANDEDDFFVQCDLCGNIKQAIDNFVQENKKEIFKSRIFELEGQNILRVKREFSDDDKIKKILFYNSDTKNFKNESGIDAPFQSFFQISNIWANTNPENESKFGSTTICGNLLIDISEKFKIDHRDQYQKFLEIFHETFNDDSAGLQLDLNNVANETEQILNEQFGSATLRFKFDNPEPNILFKNIKILVNDGEETDLIEKGHGMQRAVILSLLQVYANRITQIQDENGDAKLKPHFLFIDEPEMGLHPQAQKKLFDALCVIAKTHQVFISTHSENFISASFVQNIFRFQKVSDGIQIISLNDFSEDLKPYRKFFLHHHKLFFTNKAIFVEGADDIDRYPQFCVDNGFEQFEKDFYLLAGCTDYKVFAKLCEYLDILHYFIFDLDVLARNNPVLRSFSPTIQKKIRDFGKDTTKKDPSNLIDDKLTADELEIKNDLINSLKEESIFVLKNGALEQYLDAHGKIIGEQEKSNLIEIFANIKKTT